MTYPTAQANHHLAAAAERDIPADQAVSASQAMSKAEPIAVVGIGCRFPGGVRSLSSLGDVLMEGTEVIGGIPPGRWFPGAAPPEPDAAAMQAGAFLDDITRFDAGYFGISPREAQHLDPQHRMLMEVAWEAMSDSGVPRHAWRGSSTAVFIGMLAADYTLLQSKTLGADGIGPHYASGVEFSFAAGRLAYTFDLHGPVSTLNSACSSALLAVHHAVQSLRSGECDAALAGGVSLLVTPELNIFMNRIGAISPSGHCRPFDASADGVVRGEGCGVVVLKRLSDAIDAGDRVYATVLGSAVNHDGFSMGLTVPNAHAQAALLQTALTRSGVDPGTVGYVEAHGTGTPLGDQVELNTLAAVYGAARPASEPLLVGSCKANFGHTDAAAGILGLLKALWVASEQQAPPQPNLQTPTHAVDWRHANIAAPTSATPIASQGRPVRTAVSAFGLSGTNAHVLLEGPADQQSQAGAQPQQTQGVTANGSSAGGQAGDGPLVLHVSAAHPDLLREQADRMRAVVADADPEHVADIAACSGTRRTHEDHRLAVVAADRDGLLDGLNDPDTAAPGRYRDSVDPDGPPGVVLVFSGQGSQWPGMAAELAGSSSVFRTAIDECDALIREHVSWSLWDELRRTDGSRLGSTDIAQPAIFAIQVAVSRWLTGCGIAPAAVLGHSVGEIAAAHVAGCLSLPDAVRLVVRRGLVLEETAGSGRMAALRGSPPAVRELLADSGSPAVVAAVNGPSSVVVAGPADAVDEVLRAGGRRDIDGVPLTVNYAFHSPLVAGRGPALRQAIDGIGTATPDVRLLSSVHPDADLTAGPDAEYWVRNLTDPVLLWPAVDRLLSEGNHALVEVAPHPVLRQALQDSIAARGHRGPAVGTMRRDEPVPVALCQAAARLHVAGVGVRWERVTGTPRRYHPLPAPSWGGDDYWLPGVTPGEQGAGPVRQGAEADRNGAIAARGVAAARLSLLDEQGSVIGEFVATPGPREEQAHEDQAPDEVVPELGAGLADRVTGTIRAILGLSPDATVPPRRGLFELGLDSLTAVELRNRLAGEFGVDLPRTVVFEQPTVAELASYLAEHSAQRPPDTAIARPAAPAGAEADSHSPEPEPEPEPEDAVAVVGLACRLPGANSVADFWAMIRDGADAIGDLPADRRGDPVWAEAGPDVPTRGGYLGDVAGFDAGFFRIAPREAWSLDPQQRLFLEVAWEALEDAGIVADGLASRPAGVYLGLNTADYQQLLTRSLDDVDLYYGTGTSFAASAGRLSYFLGVRGPSMAVDTACSASLTAVHLACQSLRDGDCEMAVAGGANVILTPTVAASMGAGGALAPDGRCKTFDQAADGYGRGEGAAALILKPLPAARAAGDRVYAVIRGTAVNHGASGGLTVPSGAAQTEVIRKALVRAGWAPSEVDYVEAHGTGTPLGDPIEVRALAEALGPGRDQPLLVGSVKANIGHLEAAAGAAGLLKIILAVYHGMVPAHILGTPSERIDWEHLPVAIADRTQPWPDRGRTKRAGVSAFGFTGSNAHVLVEEAPASRETRPPPADRGGLPYVLPVTAASDEALGEAARQMAGYLRAAAPESLDDLVYTAAHRRTWFEHRLVVTGASAGELAEGLLSRPEHRARTGRVPSGEARPVVFRYGDGAPAQALRELPAYAAALETCRACLAEAGQPANDRAKALSHHVAMTSAWAAVGVTPDAVMSAGEDDLAAAWASGRLTLADALLASLGQSRGRESDGTRPHIPVMPAAGAPDSAAIVDVTSPRTPSQLALDAAALFASGCRPGPAPARPPVALPPYPWQRRPYWYRELAPPPPADDRLFEIAWERTERQTGAAGDPGTWAVVSARQGLADAVTAALEENGDHAVRIGIGDRAVDALKTLAADHPSCRGILLVCDPGDDTGSARDALAIGQAMAEMAHAPGKLWFVTSGAHAPAGKAGKNGVLPSQAALWELGRVLAVEIPGRWGGLIDVAADLGDLGAALDAQAAGGDDQLCLRDGCWYAARLRRVTGPAAPREVDPDRWHVVLAEGPAAAAAVRALARCGARRVLLAGGDPPGDIDATVQTCDAASLGGRLAGLGELGDVVAGVPAPPTQALPLVTGEDVSRQLGAASELARACGAIRAHGPQRLTLLTSAGPSWGSVNTAAAAPANGWLTGWAASRDANGETSVLALMPMADTQELAEEHRSLFEESGLSLLTAQDTADLIYAALRDQPAVRYAAAVDLNRYVRLCQELAPRTFLAGLGSPAPEPAELATALRQLTAEDRGERLADEVLDVVGAVLGLGSGDLDPDTGLSDLGMDSVMALRIRSRLEASLGLELPSTLVFEYPTAGQLADYLAGLLADAGGGQASDDELLDALDQAISSAEHDLGDGG